MREPAKEADTVPAGAGHEEDAAYLRVLALLHEQRSDQALQAAYAYLRSFPNGLKAREVRRVIEEYGAESVNTDP